MRIGVDIDDVTAALVGPACMVTGVHPNRVQTWDDFYAVFDGKLWEFLKESGIYSVLPEVPGASDVLDGLTREGHEIVFVTSRPDWAQQATEDWLRDHMAPWVFTGENLIHAEGSKLEAECDIYIDDAPHHLVEIFEAGKHAIAFDQPWNRHVTVTYRARAWTEIRAQVRSLVEWGTYRPVLEDI